MIKITLNGTDREIENDITVSKLIELVDPGKSGTAVAVNDDIVPRPEHAKRTLKAGDRVEIIRAVGGG